MHFADLVVGQSAVQTTCVTADMVAQFAVLSGDFNPLHADTDAARRFAGGTVVHGVFLLALVSALVGEQLPGPHTLARTLTAKFKAPVLAGDTVETSVRVTKLVPLLRKVVLECRCVARGRTAMVGVVEAILES